MGPIDPREAQVQEDIKTLRAVPARRRKALLRLREIGDVRCLLPILSLLDWQHVYNAETVGVAALAADAMTEIVARNGADIDARLLRRLAGIEDIHTSQHHPGGVRFSVTEADYVDQRSWDEHFDLDLESVRTAAKAEVKRRTEIGQWPDEEAPDRPA